MNRTLVTAVSMTAALILAAPSYAAISQQKAASEPASPSATLKVVTGQVLISTPDYLVLATPSGMQRFEITPTSKVIGAAAEGDEVTIHYSAVEIPPRSPAAAKAAQATSTPAQVNTASATASGSPTPPAN